MPQARQSKAKRTSRKSKKGKRRYPAARPTPQPPAKSVAKTIPRAMPSPSRPQETAPQYPYLGAELKRVGILAGAMIVALVIASMVL